ncbi:Homeobox protein 4-like protein 3 [Paramyrothecium foliicola]|nr:Homeobox protein 4-like protein 3 [Paramyrothecium foliicola]
MAGLVSEPAVPDEMTDDTFLWLWDDEILAEPQELEALLAASAPTTAEVPELAPISLSAQPGQDILQSPPLRTATPSNSKVDGRFPYAAVKALREWYEAHRDHPYPDTDQVRQFHLSTGLSQQQVKDWFANARRRDKAYQGRTSSRSSRRRNATRPDAASTMSQDIPPRSSTPVHFQHMNPMQRWQNSPPDHEPARLLDISQALAVAPRDIATERSPSSIAVSHSDSTFGSSASTWSQGSHSSAGSRSSGGRIRKQRQWPRKAKQGRRTPCTPGPSDTLSRNPYHCTFCPKTFKNRYDWQRHEKSVHLPFEHWVCSPHGPVAAHATIDAEEQPGKLCVYCGLHEPNEDHLRSHRYDQCLDKPQAERMFNRKDHFVQHLQSVHGADYIEDLMSSWKSTGPSIRSRCGFCEAQLESWDHRVDHLAGHFKQGSTMMDWKGDWGFEISVVEMLEDAMPPYLVSYEQTTPLPFPVAGKTAPTPPGAYQVLREEIEQYVNQFLQQHKTHPTDEELCRASVDTLKTAESILGAGPNTAPSWLRDLLVYSLSDGKSLRNRNQTGGQEGLFKNCQLEFQLRRYIRLHVALGQEAVDDGLRTEAGHILTRVENSCPTSLLPEYFLNFLKRLIWSSTAWLAPLRARMGQTTSAGPTRFGPSIRLHHTGLARLYAQGPGVLEDQRPEETSSHQSPLLSPGSRISNASESPSWSGFRMPSDYFISSGFALQGAANPSPQAISFYDNGYQRLARELFLFVMRTVSPNNPQSHQPTDDELRYHARWIFFNDDDPLNPTPADNAEWLPKQVVTQGQIGTLSYDLTAHDPFDICLPNNNPAILLSDLAL